MDTNAWKKWPRLYTEPDLAAGQILALPEGQAHYLKNVLRRGPGDRVRLFNGRHGEWAARLLTADKKGVTAACEEALHPQPAPGPARHLLFAPVKKNRLDTLIEKATELGATHLHPVLTQNTENRALNAERLLLQVTEASEQCERMDRPQLLPVQALDAALKDWPRDMPVFACIERADAPLLMDAARGAGACAVLVGPEGGFTDDERKMLLDPPAVRPVSLGPLVLRSETAVCAALAVLAQGGK